MGQVSMTVSMDSRLKELFESLCADLGMSVDTAVNSFVKTVVLSRTIPFVPKDEPRRNEGMALFDALREEIKNNGVGEMTMDEIDAEISQARKERKGL